MVFEDEIILKDILLSKNSYNSNVWVISVAASRDKQTHHLSLKMVLRRRILKECNYDSVILGQTPFISASERNLIGLHHHLPTAGMWPKYHQTQLPEELWSIKVSIENEIFAIIWHFSIYSKALKTYFPNPLLSVKDGILTGTVFSAKQLEQFWLNHWRDFSSSHAVCLVLLSPIWRRRETVVKWWCHLFHPIRTVKFTVRGSYDLSL